MLAPVGRGSRARPLAVVAIAPSAARAQLDAPVEEEVVPPPAIDAQAPPEEAWERYRAAVQSAIQFRTPEGRQALEAIAREESPMGLAARETLAAIDAALDPPGE